MPRKRETLTPVEPETLDLIVRGGRVVTPDGIHAVELGLLEGRIVRVAESITDPTHAELDAAGRYVFPGIVDAHVHFNEPGRAEWEGLAHGSLALAAGGGTCFFDMPLNSEPPVLDAAGLRTKRALAEQLACTDFALWGGLVPGNLDKLAGLRDAGAIGLKAFMSDSGIASFPRVDAKSLYEGMKRAAKLGLLVAVHAEDDALATQFTAAQRAKKKTDAKAWLASRPVEVELAAIRQATEFAGETGCALHIVHVSSPEGVALITEARAQRVDVTAETCSHYLLLNDKDVAKLGAPAKCAPPIRDEKRRLALWDDLRAGQIHTVGSDHSPAPPDLKTSPNFFEIWGGIGGVQHGFQLLLNACATTADRDFPLLAAVLARNVARRFRLDSRKGLLAEGMDADFCLIELGAARKITADDLWTRHKISPYLGRPSRVRVTDTYVRGRPVWADGRVASGAPKGQFLRPITT
ncbi:Allantoinase [Lacunisphaera limnophila]|uniref:Allantoinase n=1 Tax=Lacunisphaera limnophila TaxID=1838286 RepID=A0A1D8ATT7_9BACT|nr:allantoinase AllB [Lacunisphaera limnophila]AOS44292.1 Allantoinase [Lacunisphaera limnophila]